MVSRSSCPECGTILRIRDRSFVGRKVNCPDCKTALRVEASTEDENLVIRRLTAAETTRAESGPSVSKTGRNKMTPPTPTVHTTILSWINSPLTAAWLLAIACLSLFAIVMLTPKFRLSARPSPVRTERDSPVEPVPVSDSAKATRGESGNQIAPTEIPTRILNTVDERPSVSALEPANVDGPLPWPIVFAPKEAAVEPEMAIVPPPVKIDIESKMALKFPLYKQATPVSRRVLIEVLEEQLGAPIRYDKADLGEVNLDKTVTFELENTTMGGVIKSVADAAGWEIAIELTGLRLKRKLSSLAQ